MMNGDRLIAKRIPDDEEEEGGGNFKPNRCLLPNVFIEAIGMGLNLAT